MCGGLFDEQYFDGVGRARDRCQHVFVQPGEFEPMVENTWYVGLVLSNGALGCVHWHRTDRKGRLFLWFLCVLCVLFFVSGAMCRGLQTGIPTTMILKKMSW